jgi:4-diphosphocytidyl-2-C-methyl-D-erythritol kinase
MKKLFSPAKINLGLWIVRKRPDNYHDIYTVLHTVDYGDYIYITPSPILKVRTSNPQIPEGEENIVYKAIKRFEEATGISPQYDIFIEKNIPVGAGLGGGSSNAATILKFLNEEYGNPLTEGELFKLASTLGADVPFFLKGGMAIGEGIGDVLKFLDKTLNKEVFIIYPNEAVSTKKVYGLVRDDMLTKYENIPIINMPIGENEDWLQLIENKLGELAKEVYPVINEVLHTLEYLGYKGYITGSGSAVYCFGEASDQLKLMCKVKGWKLIETRLK